MVTRIGERAVPKGLQRDLSTFIHAAIYTQTKRGRKAERSPDGW